MYGVPQFVVYCVRRLSDLVMLCVLFRRCQAAVLGGGILAVNVAEIFALHTTWSFLIIVWSGGELTLITWFIGMKKLTSGLEYVGPSRLRG